MFFQYHYKSFSFLLKFLVSAKVFLDRTKPTAITDYISIDLCLLFNLGGFCTDLMFGCVLYLSYISCFISCVFHPPLLSPLFVWPSLVLLQLFKEELTQVKEGMKHINDLAHQLAISDVHLSMDNARALEHLNSRWKVLQVEITAGPVLTV